jgi:hypothetical protein
VISISGDKVFFVFRDERSVSIIGGMILKKWCEEGAGVQPSQHLMGVPAWDSSNDGLRVLNPNLALCGPPDPFEGGPSRSFQHVPNKREDNCQSHNDLEGRAEAELQGDLLDYNKAPKSDGSKPEAK